MNLLSSLLPYLLLAKPRTLAPPRNNHQAALLRRYAGNPILTAADWPYPMNTVFNAGATQLSDGRTLLLCRVEDRRGHSHLCAARSRDGIQRWVIDQQPTLLPDTDDFPEELWGIEDPRITYLPELEVYAVTYTSYSQDGPRVSLALTDDFVHFERVGAVLPPEDKDAALFPWRYNGQWMMLHRPLMDNGAHIWVSHSSDLRDWRPARAVLLARRGSWWDAHKIGLSTPPIMTEQGWLVLYHGVRETASGSLYRLGLALLDLEDPSRCLLRGDEWVFGPETPYELSGDVNGVVFPCGYTIMPDGDTLNLYYGAADSCLALATGSIRDLLSWLSEHGQPSTGKIL